MNEQLEDQAVRSQQVGEDNVDLVAWLNRILAHWSWFAIAVVVALLGGWLYLRYSTPIYKTSAKLLVVDEKRGGAGMVGGGVLDELGGVMGMKSNVDNEVEILKTFDLMREVVDELNAHIVYKTRGRIKENETLEPRYLIQVITPADSIHSTTQLVIEPTESPEQIRVYIKDGDAEIHVKLDELVSIPNLGYVRFQLNKLESRLNGGNADNWPTQKIFITPPNRTTASFMSQLTVGVTNKQTSTIDLSFDYPLPRKGELILRTLIDKYVARTLEDKNTVADSTLAFIDNRLHFVGQELGMAEDRIQSFKQESHLADISAQSQILIENASQYAKDLAAVESQLLMIDEADRYLADVNNPRVVPTSVSANDPTFSNLVQNYNRLLLERERLLLSQTEDNPFVVNIDKQIRGLREDMRSNLSSARRQLMVTRDGLARQSRQLEAEIRRVPATERGFIDLSRQQQIKQELYLFLQQKWEETAIGKTANISNAKVIDGPRSGGLPISPKRNVIYLACVVLGLAVPFGAVYLRELLNVRVQTKEDITRRTQLSILGEIGHNLDSDHQIVISRESRSPIAEQFRALRTNLDFFGPSSGTRTVMFTSSMSGEGKSFVAVNLAMALALSNKRVVLLEFDLRKPTVSQKLGLDNQFGFTNYIVQQELTVADVLRPSGQLEGFDVISSGPIPPNPAEIILHDRTHHLFDELRLRYDYVIIDAPPIGAVADAQLLSRYADTTLYVIRQGVTFKKQLEIPEDLAQYKKMPSLNLVVNDIQARKGYSYGGYGYGYGQGYGYGYYNEPAQRKWWHFIKKRI